MSADLPSLVELEAAAGLVHAVIPPTPEYCWPLLCQRTGTEVWVKHENHTPTGAFKVRGGLVYIEDLKRSRPDVQTVVTATRGNHGQSIGIVQVSDAEVEVAMRAYFTDTHNVAEGAGATGLAALLQEKDKMVGRKVGLVLCGGNVDRDVFARVLLGDAKAS